jgi:nucleotide-binding universal stress UspA family protein
MMFVVCGVRPTCDRGNLQSCQGQANCNCRDRVGTGTYGFSSPLCSDQLRACAAMARHFHADLIVIHAFILSQSAREAESPGRVDSAERRQLETQLRATVASLVPSGRRVLAQLLEGEPSEKIARFANGIPHSSLVLGTHGGGSVEGHLIGSVAERSLRRAASPTITVGPRVPELSDTRSAPTGLRRSRKHVVFTSTAVCGGSP